MTKRMDMRVVEEPVETLEVVPSPDEFLARLYSAFYAKLARIESQEGQVREFSKMVEAYERLQKERRKQTEEYQAQLTEEDRRRLIVSLFQSLTAEGRKEVVGELMEASDGEDQD